MLEIMRYLMGTSVNLSVGNQAQAGQGFACWVSLADDAGLDFEEWSWILENIWNVTQSEVDEGFVDKEGGIIMAVELLISFCPYCAYKFSEIRKNSW